MKSAYELAMERLKAKEGNLPKLTDEQKKLLHAIDDKFTAKIAERETFLRKTLEETLASGNREEAQRIRDEMFNEKARLEEEREEQKDKVRKQAKK